MIRDNQRYFNRLHVVIDAVVICIAYVLAWIYKFLILKDQRGLTLAQYCVALIGIIPLYLMLYLACNLYTSKRVQGRRLEGGNIVKANTIGILIVMAAFFPLRDVIEPIKYYSRWMLAYFYVINIVLEIIARNLIRWLSEKDPAQSGFNLRHLIFVGYSGAAEAFIDRILCKSSMGVYNACGILDDNKEPGYTYKGIAVLGSTDELEKILENNRLDEIALTLALREYYKLKRIVAICEKSGVHTKFVPDYNDIIPTRPYTEDL